MKYKFMVMILFITIIFLISRQLFLIKESAFGAVSSCFLYPVLRIQQLVIEPIKQNLQQRKTMHELQHSYDILRQQYEDVVAENIALQAMRFYTHEIQELSDFKKRYYPQHVRIAQVIVRHLSAQNQFFLVNVGSYQGIKKYMVALYHNCLVGRVTHVYPWYCKICLIIDKECNVAAVCAKTGATGIIEGMNNTEQMTMRYISHLTHVEENDMVLASGDGLIFPNGFGLGTILSTKKGDLFYDVSIKPLLDFYSLRYCIVISKDEIEQ